MAKIEAYKFINPGMAVDNASEGSLVGRKLVLSFNHFGKTLNSMGNVVKDIENIEIARLKNDAIQERIERRQEQRDRDQEAEDAIERRNLDKKDSKKPNKSFIKGFFGKSKVGKQLMNQMPLWVKALEPIFRLILEIFRIAVIKEMLEWWSDPENKKKIETFFHKAEVIFNKLKEFSQFIQKTISGGWEKLQRGDTFGERVKGLGELILGIGIVGGLLNPIATFGLALQGFGWLIKNLHEWFKDPLAFLKKPKVAMPKQSSGKTKGSKANQVNKYAKNKGPIKPEVFLDNKGKFQGTPSRAPHIGDPGSGVKPQKGWKGALNKTKSFIKKLKVPGWVGKTKRLFGPTTTAVFAGMELNDRIESGESVEKAISGTVASTGFGLAGFTMAANATLPVTGPMMLAPEPLSSISGALLYFGTGIAGSMGFGTVAGMTSDAAWDAHEDKNEKSKWWNPFSWGNNNKPNAVEQKTQIIPKKEVKTENKKGFWGNLFSGFGSKKEEKKQVVVPQSTKKTDSSKKNKKWWEFWKGNGGKLPEFFFGKIFKGITKTVGSVFNGVKNAVGSVINTVSNVVSNPIVSTALSFIPGVGPIVQGINAFNALRQGDLMGAVMGGVGALGSFANINTVNAISQPRWMQNLRFSKFGQGLAGMYHSGANAWAGLTSGVNNFMGSKWGSLAKGVYQGATGGGWGGALSAGSNILGLNEDGAIFGKGGFFGEGGRMANMGNWLQEHNLAGIGNMFPGLAGMVNGFPGFSQLPGIQDLFAGGFSPMQAIGGLAEKNGMGGLYKSAMGLLGGGDMVSGLKELAGEIGVNPEALGAVEKGKSLYDRAKSVALNKDPVELLPIIMPIIQDQIVLSPAIKEKAVIVHDAYNSFTSRL